jgi:hypothetical protein
MTTNDFIKARVSTETKRLVACAAAGEHLTESVWLRRLVKGALTGRTAEGRDGTAVARRMPDGRGELARRPCRGTRVCIRLRSEDVLILRARAEARGMASATYGGIVVRAHLRNVAPLVRQELSALRHAISELGALRRLLARLACAQGTANAAVSAAADLVAVIKVCGALRDHVKTIVVANRRSWESGHVAVDD